MTTRALMEKTIPYSPHLGMLFGCCGALFLQQVHYWCDVNKEKKQNYKEGHYWCYNTYKEWEEQFCDFDQSTLRRKIQLLVSAGVLVMGRYNKQKYDKTNWYRVDYLVLEQMLKDSPMPENTSQSDNDPLLKLDSASAQIEQSDTSKLGAPIPKNKTKTNDKEQDVPTSGKKGNTMFDKNTGKGKKPMSAMDILKQHKAAKNPEAPAVATVSSMISIWQHIVPKHNDSVKFVGTFTMVQKGMFSKIIQRWGGPADSHIHYNLTYVLMHWVKFTKKVEESAGLKLTPSAPNVPFLLKYAEEARNFYHNAMSKPVAAPIIKAASPKVNPVSTPVQEETPMTMDELKAFGEKYGYETKT